MSVEAKIVTEDGSERLRIEFANKYVQIAMPATADDIELACEVLITNLAGVSKCELVTAGFLALMGEDA